MISYLHVAHNKVLHAVFFKRKYAWWGVFLQRHRTNTYSQTIKLCVVMEFEKLLPGTTAWFCTKDKYNLPMFSDVCQAETKAQ
jgi:hypothetical protein